MNAFQKIANEDREAFRDVRRRFQKECRAYPLEFQLVHNEALSEIHHEGKRPVAAWRNRHFYAALFEDEAWQSRLSVNRTELLPDGGFRGDITWDELMAVKRGIGMGDFWMVEIYPADEEVVNVANIRHLWLTPQPAFAWVKQEPCVELPKCNPILRGFRKVFAGIFRGRRIA